MSCSYTIDDDFSQPQSETRSADRIECDRQLGRRRFVDKILRWFRTCAHCKSIWPPIELLCENCWSQLLTFENSGERLLQKDYPFPVYALFTWSDENDRLVRAFLRAFKKGRCVSVAELLADRLAYARLADWPGEMPRFAHPPSSSGARDHSWLLAQCLASKWGGGSEPAQTMAASQNWSIASQKSKSAADRSLIRYEREEKISGCPRPIVFVDDVITTGSTAMAAYMALGDPARYAVWTLVCRPKLAGKSRI